MRKASSKKDMRLLGENVDRVFQILVVDDVSANRKLIKEVLADPIYQVTEAANGEQALSFLADKEFDVILLDVLMPGIDGFEVCRRIRNELSLTLTPIIMLSALDSSEDVVRGMEEGADDYVSKPFRPVELRARVNSALSRKVLTDRLEDTENVLFALARMVEAKDSNTGNHCDRLSHMGVAFGQVLGLGYQEIEALRRGGILHDIGKLGIPDHILLKTGPLEASEWAVMKQHPEIGARLCEPLKTMTRTVEIIRHHHEKWNGGGYPGGMGGEEIPLTARVFQIVDVFDALVNARPYKPAYDLEQAIEILDWETAEGMWDPQLMREFLAMVRETPIKMLQPPAKKRDVSATLADNALA